MLPSSTSEPLCQYQWVPCLVSISPLSNTNWKSHLSYACLPPVQYSRTIRNFYIPEIVLFKFRKSNWIFYKYLIIKHSYLIINFWETKQKQKWRETRFCSFTCFPCFLSYQIPSFLCLDEKNENSFCGLDMFLADYLTRCFFSLWSTWLSKSKCEIGDSLIAGTEIFCSQRKKDFLHLFYGSLLLFLT